MLVGTLVLDLVNGINHIFQINLKKHLTLLKILCILGGNKKGINNELENNEII